MSESIFSCGMVKLGSVKESNGGQVRILFTFVNQGFKYLGQASVKPGKLEFEVFNSGFFSVFSEKDSEIEAELRTLVLRELVNAKGVADPFCAIAERLLAREPCSRLKRYARDKNDIEEINLKKIFDRLNREYFSGKLKGQIQWGTRYGRNNRRSIRYGSYDCRAKLIRINPVLARKDVPRQALEMTIYHEMCHQAFPPIYKNGHWQVHHNAFKRKEREYPHYEEVARWERVHWKSLLKS